MPIQIESVQTASGNSATADFAVEAAGENRAIAALVGLYSPLGEEVTSAAYAGQALTRQALVESSFDDHSEIWTRLDPPAGSNTLALDFTFPGNPRGWVVGGVALSGVESIRGAEVATGDSGPADPSLSIATQPGDVVLSVLTFYDAAIDPASGAAELFDLVDPTEDTYCAGSALTASGASTTVAWAFAGTPAENWALAATAFAPAVDEGGEPTTIDLAAASVGIAGSAIRSRLATALTAPAVAFAAQPTRQSLAVGFAAPGIVVAPQSVRPRSVASLIASALALALRPAVGRTTGGVNAAAFGMAGRPLAGIQPDEPLLGDASYAVLLRRRR